ncbi:MAG TPA: hypothetical protein VG454_09480 [Gemmatimonadales bacterium]|nr:hypothetical protein [Gemmatimonadales bacterium]
MSVDVERQLRIGVPEDARDRVQVRAGGQQQARGGVAQIVETNAARQRDRHQLPPPLRQALAPSAQAAGAVALRVIRLPLLVPAPAAQVSPASHQPCMHQRAVEHVAHRRVVAEHLPVGARKDEFAFRGGGERVLEVRQELGCNGNRLLVRSLGGPIVAVAHGDDSAAEVDIHLA